MKYILAIFTIITSTTFLCAAEEPQDLTKLREKYVDAVKRAVTPINETYISALQRLKNRYTRSGDLEAINSVDQEMKSVLGALEEIAVGEQKNKSDTGDDFKQLEGVWEVEGSTATNSRTFEFKSRKTMLFTYVYETSGGGSHSITTEYEADKEEGKFVLEAKNSRSSSSSKQWYEIKTPFNLDSLEITRYSESDTSKSSSTYVLKRKKKERP